MQKMVSSKLLLYKTTYRKVVSTNASHFVAHLVYMHTQNDNFLIRGLVLYEQPS